MLRRLSPSTVAVVVVRRRGRGSRRRRGRGGTVVGYLLEELVVIAAVILVVIVELVTVVRGAKPYKCMCRYSESDIKSSQSLVRIIKVLSFRYGILKVNDRSRETKKSDIT